MKKVLQRLLRLFLRIHDASRQPVQKRARRQIHHHHLVGLLHHPIRDRFAHANSGDLPDLIVQALQVLDVHGGEHVDAGVQQKLHILPAFQPVGARHIGVRELIHHANLRMAAQDRVRIHLLKESPAIVDLAPRNNLQTLRLCDGVLAAVRLEIADHHVVPLALQLLRFFQHLIGLADAGGIAQKDLEFSASVRRIASVRHT